jgi:hypothetical protein
MRDAHLQASVRELGSDVGAVDVPCNAPMHSRMHSVGLPGHVQVLRSQVFNRN